MSKPVLGAQLYTVRQFTQTIGGVAESLKKVRDIGYSTVQISGLGPVDPKEVAGIVADLGLTAAATHVSWGRLQNELLAVIEEHKLWNCTHPAISYLPGEYAGAEGLDRFLDELLPIAEALAGEGIDLSYHNHSQELAGPAGRTWLAMLYERTDPKVLKPEIDTYWIQRGGGDPAEWIGRYPHRQCLVHFKDMTVTEKGEPRFAEVGEGNINWVRIIEAVAEAGVEYAFVEQDDCYGRDPFESLAISYRNLKQMGLS